MRYVTNCTNDFAEMLPHVAASVFRCTQTDLHCYDLDGNLDIPPHVVMHRAPDLKTWLPTVRFGTRKGGKQKWPGWFPKVCDRALSDADGESITWIGSDSLMIRDITPILADADIATTVHSPAEFRDSRAFGMVNLNVLTYSPFAAKFVESWDDLTSDQYIDQESFVRLMERDVNFKHVSLMVEQHCRYTQVVNGLRVLFLPMHEFNRTTGIYDMQPGDDRGAYLLHFRAMAVKPQMRDHFFAWAQWLSTLDKEAVSG